MKSKKTSKKAAKPFTQSANLFPVVGIGASAGGLDAFKKLLTTIPENSGMAFVLVEHLGPGEYLHQLVKELPAGVYSCDAQGRINFYNKTAAKLWGREPEIGKEQWCGSWKLLKPDGSPVPLNDCPMAIAIKEGHAVMGEELIIERSDGTRSNVLVYLQPELNLSGEVTGAINMVIDITEQVSAKKTIEESEKQFIHLANNIQNLAWMANADGWIFWYNDRWYEYTGTTPQEMEGWGWKSVHDPEQLPFVIERWQQSINTGQPFEMVFPLRGADKVFRAFLTRVIPIHDKEGKVFRWIGTNTDISEERKQKEKIEESEHRYREMVYSSPLIITILQGEELIMDIANDSILEHLGKGKDIVGKPYLKSNPELEEQGIGHILREVYRTGVPFQTFETPVYLISNGKKESRYYNYLVQPQRKVSGEIEGIAIMATEVTSLVELNNKIKESEERFRYVVEQTLSPICILKGEDMILEVANEPVFKIWNVGKEALGKPFLEIVPEMKDQPFMDLLLDVFRNGVTHYGTEWPAYFIGKDGEKENFYFNFVYQPYREPDGSISGVFVFANDVTEQVIAKNKNLETQELRKKELEEKVQQRTFELNEANEELQKKNQEIALSKYNKLFLTEFSEKFSAYKLHNEFFNSLVQFIADTTRLDYVFVGKLEQNNNEDFAIQTIALTVFNKLTENINYPLPDGPCEQVIRGTLYSYPDKCKITFPKNQTLVQFNVEGYIGYPLFDPRGNAIGLIAVMHEKGIEDPETVASILKIVAKRAEIEMERIRYEEQLVLNNKMLEEKNEEQLRLNKELESFNYISSHDLQEPLRKIQTFANRILGREHAVLSDKGKDDFSRIQNAAGRMQKLIEDLLAYSRTNITERKVENISLNDIVEDTKKDLAEIIMEKNAVIKTGELVSANINPSQFRQAMNNLVANSLKFSRPGIPPHISIKSKIDEGLQFQNENPGLPVGRLSPHKKYCHIRISDNGIGFDPKYKDQIFEVFQRLYGKDEYPGTGIGLAIVKKIVENHNGIITATGEPDKGSRFDIYIPC